MNHFNRSPKFSYNLYSRAPWKKNKDIQNNEIHKNKSAIWFNSCDILDVYIMLLQVEKPHNSNLDSFLKISSSLRLYVEQV